MILRDNWQGEFAVALFGAIGWSVVSMFNAGDMADNPSFSTLIKIAPEPFWEAILLVFGAIQLVGLRKDKPFIRAVGAAGCFIAFFCVFLSLLADDAGLRSLGLYAAAIVIEFCAIVFQVTRLCRTGGYNWPWTIFHS